MKRILIGLAASAALLSASTGAFASTQLNKSDNGGVYKSGAIQLAQASGDSGGNAGAGQPDKETKKMVKPNADDSGSVTKGENTDPAIDPHAESGDGKPEQHTGSGGK